MLAGAGIFGMEAAILTPSQALERAAGVGVLKSAGLQTPHAPKLLATKNIADQPAVYVYEGAGGSGFMILSADDRAVPLLGYRNDGAFDAEEMNPALQWWLDEYAREIKWLRDNPAIGQQTFPIRRVDKETIGPLLTTKWNQDAPYNNMCPVSPEGSRCPTGCVATAMAQIINYFRLPAEHGTGKVSLTYEGKEYTFDFDSETFDWDNMLDFYGAEGTYTQTQADAVAKLMYACGVSVDMGYSPQSSGASSQDAAVALVNNFGFSPSVCLVNRDWFGLEDWSDLIYTQLKENGPVYYGGDADVGGHAFVCDGYSGDGFFHFNWGWGGMSDGNFRLTALNPLAQGIGGSTGGFNSRQEAICNIRPPREDDKPFISMYSYYDLGVADKEGNEIESIELGESFNLSGFFISAAVNGADFVVGYKLETVADGSVSYTQCNAPETVPLGYGYEFLPVTLPSTLAEGEYRLTPVWRVDGSDEWQLFRLPITSASDILVTVKGSTAAFSTAGVPQLKAEAISWTTPAFAGMPVGVDLKLHNPSEKEYLGDLFGVLLTTDGDVAGIGNAMPVDILPGDTSEVNYTSALSSVDGGEIAAGSYKYVIIDHNSRIISPVYDITLQAAPEEQGTLNCDSFEFVGDAGAADPMQLEFKARITCTKGYYIGEIRAWIFAENDDYPISGFSSGLHFIPEGGTVEVTFSGAMAQLEAGHKYSASLFDDNGWIMNGDEYAPEAWFTVKDPSGISAIETDADSPREVYTLSGIRVTGKDLAPGIYIVRTAGKTGKIVVK